jgi:hypothetical protein
MFLSIPIQSASETEKDPHRSLQPSVPRAKGRKEIATVPFREKYLHARSNLLL